MSSIEIRREEPGDFAAIREVIAAAFESEDEADLVEAIRASEHYLPALSFVAVVDGEIAAHTMISYGDLHDGSRTRRIAVMAPVAVAPAHQRRGVGSTLIREALRRAEAAGEPMVTVEGDPAYYGRLGFVHSVPLGITFDLPDWAPAEAAQVFPLRDYDPAIRGHLVYPEAFA